MRKINHSFPFYINFVFITSCKLFNERQECYPNDIRINFHLGGTFVCGFKFDL